MNKVAKYFLNRNIITISDLLYFDKNKTITIRNENNKRYDKKTMKKNNSITDNNITLENPKDGDKLFSLYNEVLACKKCSLCNTRNNVVFGKGSPNADIVFIGEAPGADEDKFGFPFVGRGGRLLDSWFARFNLTLEDIYVMNAIKCRPPENRDPTEEEKTSCRNYFDEQIKIIKPKIICALGKHAFSNLVSFDMKETYSKMRGVVHRHKNIPVIATYHPAFILRNNNFQSKVDEDFTLLLNEYKKL